MCVVFSERYAVVTGANKGIGFETVKQLASNGVKVVLTARDENRGQEAIGKLKDYGLSDLVTFHQLDVTHSASIDSLAEYVKTQFGKLDILVRRSNFSFLVAVISKSSKLMNCNLEIWWNVAFVECT